MSTPRPLPPQPVPAPAAPGRPLTNSDPRVLLKYFNVGERTRLEPAPMPVERRKKRHRTSEGSSVMPSTYSSTVSTVASTAAPSTMHSRRPSTTSGLPFGPNVGTGSMLAPPPQAPSTSRHGMSRLNSARILDTQVAERILPPSPFSPVVTQPKLELDKKSEDDLVNRLVEIQKIAVSQMKVPDAKDPVSVEFDPPPTPPTVDNDKHKDFVTYLRRASTVGRMATDLAQKEITFAVVNGEQQANAQTQNEFDWLRINIGLEKVISKEEIADAKWKTPFILNEVDTEDVYQKDYKGKVKQLFDSFEEADCKDGVITLPNIDLDNPELRLEVFRFGVRCALLTAKREKQFHEFVNLIAAANTTNKYRLDDPRALFPFLKTWEEDPTDRKIVQKAELKRQLDLLGEHTYYTPAAFGGDKDARSKAAYFSWLKNNALRIHRTLMNLSEEIADLKARRGMQVPAFIQRCMGQEVEEEPTDESDQDDEWEYEPPHFEELKEPPAVDKKPQRFGRRPDSLQKKKDEALRLREARRAERKERNLKKRNLRKSMAKDPEALADISSDELEESSSEGSSDEQWVRTPLEMQKRDDYLQDQNGLREMHMAFAAQQKRKEDAKQILHDLGLGDLSLDEKITTKNYHTLYAVLFYGLLESQPDLAHTRVNNPPPPNVNPDFKFNAMDQYKQKVYTTEAHLNPLFNPNLSPDKKVILENFGNLWNVDEVFRNLVYLQVLSVNLQRTWSYWATVLSIIERLESLKRVVGWTKHEQQSYIVYLERIIEWGAQCVSKFYKVFTLPVNYRTKEAEKAKKEQDRVKMLEEREQALKAKEAEADHFELEAKKAEEAKKDPKAAAAAAAAAATEEKGEKKDATSPAAPNKEEDTEALAIKLGIQEIDPLKHDSPAIHNTSREAYTSCLDVVYRSWHILFNTMKYDVLSVVPAQVPQFGVMPKPIPEDKFVPAKYKLDEWLNPLMRDALHDLYEDLSWNAGRLAVPPPKDEEEKKDDHNNPNSHPSQEEERALVPTPPFNSDLHLTLMLHSIVHEIAYDVRISEKFLNKHFKGLSDFYIELSKQVLMDRYWADAHYYITRTRIPPIVAKKNAEVPLIRNEETGEMEEDEEAEKTKLKAVGLEINAVFSMYMELIWFQYINQTFPIDIDTNKPDLSVQQKTIHEWQRLRKWFVPIVDGFIEAILDQIEEDVTFLEVTSGIYPKHLQSKPTPGAPSVPQSNQQDKSLNTVRKVMLQIDAYLSMLTNKPCTNTHKRNLIDALARLLETYAHIHLHASGVEIEGKEEKKVGINEELQIRHFLNQNYNNIYPPVLTEKEKEKKQKKALEDFTRKKQERQEALRLGVEYVESADLKPEHKFGYDSIVPQLSCNTIQKLNELRVANVKLDQLYRVVLGNQDLEQRGPHAHGVQNLLIQTVAFIAKGLCEVIMPNVINNLLTLAKPKSDGTMGPRWSSEKIEKVLSEGLGFLYEHIEWFKMQRMHVELIRELGMYLLLEIYELINMEMRNVTKVVVDDVVYFRKRDVEYHLVKDQFLRIQEAFKILKAFVIDVCLVPDYWFDSTFPERPGTETVPLAQTLGLGPYGQRNLANDSHMPKLQPVVLPSPKPASATSPPAAASSSGSPPAAAAAGVLSPGSPPPPNIPAEPELMPGEVVKPKVPWSAPAKKYLLQPGWSSIPFVLCEIWKCEKILNINLAPSLVLISLYKTHIDRRTPAERAAAAELERRQLAAIAEARAEMEAAELEETPEEIAELEEKRTSRAPSRAHSRAPTVPGTPMTHSRRPSVSPAAAFAASAAAALTSPFKSGTSTPGTATAAASGGAPMLNGELHVDVSSPAGDMSTLHFKGDTTTSGGTKLHPPVPVHIHVPGENGTPGFYPPKGIASLIDPNAPPTFPHPYAMLGFSRWDIYRLLQARARYQDDSAANDWLCKAKKPDRPKEIEPPSFLDKVKITTLFAAKT